MPCPGKSGKAWLTAAKFESKLPLDKKGETNFALAADLMVESTLDKLVKAELSPGPRVKGIPASS